MPLRQTLPAIWLVSDERNDTELEAVLGRLPPGSGLVFRHYYLEPAERRARFRELADKCRKSHHIAALSDDGETALEWGADAVYGPAARLGNDPVLLRLATAHDESEIEAANRAKADAVFVSPIYATRSHADAEPLGADGFARLSALASMPAIALGGMTAARAHAIGARRWAAIDALVH